MGTLANSLFQGLMGWIRSLSAEVWNTIQSPEGTTLLSWLGQHWKGIALILCLIGMAADVTVYLFRWQPYRVWQSRRERRRRKRAEKGREAPEEAREDGRQTPFPLRRAEEGFDAETISGFTEERAAAPYEPNAAPWQEEAGLGGLTGGAYPAAGPEEEDAGRFPAEEKYRTAEEPDAGAWDVYRRPAARYVESSYSAEAEEAEISAWRGAEAEAQDTPENMTAKFDQALRPRRRRRVREILTDSLEENAPAPEDLIDRREAYRKPVYPRSWQEEN